MRLNPVLFGSVVAAYAYNRAGEKGMLPEEMGWITPSTTFAKVMGGTAFLATLATPKHALKVSVVAFGVLIFRAFSSKNKG
jgi:hypothetical protein